MPRGFLEQALCLALLCQAGAWEELGKILYFFPPLAEDILPYEAVANTELKNYRQQALPWQTVSPGGQQTELSL